MTTLLFGVFGFFTLHALLWLQRSLVGVMRGEFKEHRESDEKWVRRFKSSHIRTHLVVVVTFLLLAATGLPLRFHDTDWAQVLVGLFGGAADARSLHRFAAILTFGYALYHLAYLIRKVVIEKKIEILWGWASLVPNPKDLKDFFAYLKYFLYMGDRPKFDRFTYWEKFDYFAVFWGIPIIGGSGLVLWNSEAFATFLPGWALNAAYLIHADEALLATGFIFFFHFFHTHLRPESFPIDPVIFVGKMPLRRFKEERPMEYERLVESGKLEDYLEKPPTRRAMRRAMAFGFLALFIGLVLAVGILWGFLTH
jgi:cytochrome b subunit of formate dehydrogenase